MVLPAMKDDREGPEARVQSDPLLTLAAVPEGARGPGALGEMAELQRFANAGRLVASVAHEMRNALAAAQANLAYLADALADKDEPTLVEAAADARGAIDRALGTTKNVLNLVRGCAASVAPVQVSEVVNRALLAVGSKLGSGLRLEIDLEPVPSVEVDESALHQALVNILLNAVDAAPEHDPRLRVSVRRSEKHVCIAVADNGPGVALELRDRLFQPMSSGKVERGGAGLGLSISRALVRASGGDLIAGDGPLGGAEFSLLLRPCS